MGGEIAFNYYKIQQILRFYDIFKFNTYQNIEIKFNKNKFHFSKLEN
jgi:hypothetical protein